MDTENIAYSAGSFTWSRTLIDVLLLQSEIELPSSLEILHGSLEVMLL